METIKTVEKCKYHIGDTVVFEGNAKREIDDIRVVISYKTKEYYHKIYFKDGLVMEESQVDRLRIKNRG